MGAMLLLFGGMILLIMIGVPIGYAIGTSSILTYIFFTDVPLNMVALNCFTGLNSFTLLAIPFFILAGAVMGAGGIAKRLVDLADSIVGFITGGLGMVGVVTSTFFGAITGSSLATTSAVGSLVLPSMKEKGYETRFSATLIASAGVIGIIIPPSIPFVLYGVATGTSISDLFMAGIIPGLLMAAALMTTCYIISKRRGYGGSGTKFQLGNVFKHFKRGVWALLAPIIILGGIYSGAVTPTESAVVAVVYSILVGLFLYRELNLKSLMKAFYDAAIINGITSFIMGFSAVMAKYLSFDNIPAKLCDMVLALTDNKILILILLNIILLIVGMLIDIIPATIILAPIFLPIVVSFGMSPVTFGVMMSMNLGIGFVTPPYGATLFVASALTKTPVEKLFKNAFFFTGVMIIVLLIVTYVPAVTVGLLE